MDKELEQKNHVFYHKTFPRELSGRISFFRDHNADRLVFGRVGFLLSSLELKIQRANKNQNKRVSISSDDLTKMFDELAFIYCRHLKPDDEKWPAPIELTNG